MLEEKGPSSIVCIISESHIIIDPKKTTKEKWKKDSKCLCRRYCNGGGNEQGDIGG